MNADLKVGNSLVVIGAGGGLGQFAVGYGLVHGAHVVGIDTGSAKRELVKSLGADFLDFAVTSDLVGEVTKMTAGGAHAVVVTAGNSQAYAAAADMLRIGGTLSACGIPPGGGNMETKMSTIVIKGLRIKGNLVGSLKECTDAVDLVRRGAVKPRVLVRPFRDLPAVYEELEKGDIAGRVVLQVGKDPIDEEPFTRARL